MARKSKDKILSEVHQTALARFDRALSACQGEREQALEDRRFYSISGAQWEGVFGEQFANRPMLEVNKVHLSVMRIINEYRNNRIAATFTSKTGDEGDDLADFCAGKYRADKQDSGAEEAIDNAFEEAAGGGFGAWRLRTEYVDEYDEEDDRQRICWEPIFDADTCVFFDPASRKQDKSDAGFCFVLTTMSEEDYRADYGDDLSEFDRPITDAEFDWSSDEGVYVAEYYEVQDKYHEVVTYRNIAGEFERYPADDLDDEKVRALAEIGTIPVGRKKVKRRQVHKYILSGDRVLEDCGPIAGSEIPIIPVYGKRWFVDGVERFMGHVRLVKDAQRLKNMQISLLAEQAANGGERTPIFLPEQIANHEYRWAEKAVEKPAYLLVNPIQDAAGNPVASGPVGYTETPDVSPAQAALMQVAEQDIADILGNQNGGEEIVSNISGKAVELIQARLDMQTFIYISNLAKAERRCAEVWLAMARELYDAEDGRVKIVDEQETVDYVDMGEAVLGPDGTAVRKYDMRQARFDVGIDIGPTSSSKRQATIRALSEMLQFVADPTDQKVISASVMRNMDGEGISALREYYRKQLVQLGVEEPTEADKESAAQAQGNAQPTPQDVYLQSEAIKNEAQAEESRADAAKAAADTIKVQAQTAEILAGIDRAERQQAIEAAKAIADAVGSGTGTPQVPRANGGPPPLDRARQVTNE